MAYVHFISTCAIVLALFGASVEAQTAATSDSKMETWKLIAIIVPSVVGGLTILSVLFFCCCCRAHYNGSGGMMCGDCSGGAGCCGPRGGCDCGPGAGCDCGPGGCCGPSSGCHCGPGGACDCGNCCGGCCYETHHQTQRTVYSSQQGPIQVQPAYNVRNYAAPQPSQQTYFSDPTYVSSLPVGQKYGGGVYGGAPRAPVYSSGPVVRGGGGCGCG